MNFGLFSNGLRPHATAAAAYDDDLHQICVADELGFRDAYISEHHGEPVYAGRADVLPAPELLMAKAAAVTKRIRLGAGVKILHLSSPFDVAAQAAVTDHLLGGRYVFGYGSGFPNPWFAESRGLSWEGRYPRTAEALDLILRCWTNDEPFDFDGRFYRAKDLVVLPKPLQRPHPPIATATLTRESVRLAGARAHELLLFAFGPLIRELADVYAAGALATGCERPLAKVTVGASVYLADSVEEAMDDIRDAAEWELRFQRARGLMRLIAPAVGRPEDRIGFDELVEAGWYIVGDPDTVIGRLERLYEESGGFGTLLLTGGKSWATPERREESLRRFAGEVAPRLAPLMPDRVPEELPVAT
jgi:limonene 1,2-monooxygenase